MTRAAKRLAAQWCLALVLSAPVSTSSAFSGTWQLTADESVIGRTTVYVGRHEDTLLDIARRLWPIPAPARARGAGHRASRVRGARVRQPVPRISRHGTAWLRTRSPFSAPHLSDEYIAGMFTGPRHQEVGGEFRRDGIEGGFGAKRQ